MSEKKNENAFKVVIYMIIFMILAVLGLAYYPIVKDKIDYTVKYQTKSFTESSEDLSEGNEESNMDSIKGKDLENKEVAVFNYLTDEVYRTDDVSTIEVKEKRGGYVLKDQDGTLKAAFLGDSWYSLEILPKTPIEAIEIMEDLELPEGVSAKGEIINVEE